MMRTYKRLSSEKELLRKSQSNTLETDPALSMELDYTTSRVPSTYNCRVFLGLKQVSSLKGVRITRKAFSCDVCSVIDDPQQPNRDTAFITP